MKKKSGSVRFVGSPGGEAVGVDRGGAGAHLARKHLPFWKSRHMGWFACAAGCEPSWLLCA